MMQQSRLSLWFIFAAMLLLACGKIQHNLRTGGLAAKAVSQDGLSRLPQTVKKPAQKSKKKSCNIAEKVAAKSLKRLTRFEYLNTIRDLFGADLVDEVRPSTDLLPIDFMKAESIRAIDFETDSHRFAYKEIAKNLSGAVSEKLKTQLPSPCNLACQTNWIERWGLKVFRRPLDSGEVSRFQNVFSFKDISLGEKLAIILEAMLLSPDFIFKPEFLNSKSEDSGFVPLSEFELAVRLAFFLTGSTPDDRVLDLAKKSALRKNLAGEVRRLLAVPKAKENIILFFEEWSKYTDRRTLSYAPDYANGLDVDKLQLAALSEADAFVQSIIFDDKEGLEALFSSNKALVTDKDLAEIYQMKSSPKFQQSNRNGFLNRFAFLAQSGKADPAIHRGSKILNSIVCMDLKVPEIAEGADVEELVRADLSTREKTTEATKTKVCSSCHNLINPIGFSFGHYDNLARFKESEELDFEGMLSHHPIDVVVDYELWGSGKKTIKDSNEMSEYLGAQPIVHACFIRGLRQFATGHLKKDLKVCDQEDLVQASLKGAPVQEVILSIVESEFFTHKYTK